MTQSDNRLFADVLLSSVNLQDGQSVYLKCEPIHWNFVNVLAA